MVLTVDIALVDARLATGARTSATQVSSQAVRVRVACASINLHLSAVVVSESAHVFDIGNARSNSNNAARLTLDWPPPDVTTGMICADAYSA